MVEPGFKCKHFDIRVSAPVASGCLCGAWPGKGCVDASVIIWLDLSLAVQFSTTHLLPSLSGCFWGMLAASLPLLSWVGASGECLLPPCLFCLFWEPPNGSSLLPSLLCWHAQPCRAWWPQALLTPWQEACPTNGIIISPLQLKMALSIWFYTEVLAIKVLGWWRQFPQMMNCLGF